MYEPKLHQPYEISRKDGRWRDEIQPPKGNSLVHRTNLENFAAQNHDNAPPVHIKSESLYDEISNAIQKTDSLREKFCNEEKIFVIGQFRSSHPGQSLSLNSAHERLLKNTDPTKPTQGPRESLRTP
uniref:Uncharacterized protein n=1 Tax=Romanomermis culicivorax TaxID=13658 RepID=A0A915K4U8_ROMCU